MLTASPMPHSKPVRVVIVDDHPGIRQGLRAMLELCGDYALCGEAESAAQALDIIASEKPDVAIVDISLKGSMHGLELTRQLKSLHPEVSVLVLSLHGEAEFAEGAIAAGASGYLSKSEAGEFLPDALQAILGGEIYATPEMQAKMARAKQAGASRAANGTDW
jgi:DNA-binding NarL/FixJ family response regulator